MPAVRALDSDRERPQLDFLTAFGTGPSAVLGDPKKLLGQVSCSQKSGKGDAGFPAESVPGLSSHQEKGQDDEWEDEGRFPFSIVCPHGQLGWKRPGYIPSSELEPELNWLVFVDAAEPGQNPFRTTSPAGNAGREAY